MHVFFPAARAGLSRPQRHFRGAFAAWLFSSSVRAVIVRETARLMMAAYLDLKLRAVLLLPIGGLFAYANPESQEAANQGSASSQWLLPGPSSIHHGTHACRRLHWFRRRRHLLARPSSRPITWCAVWCGCRLASAPFTCFRPTRSTSVGCCAATLPARTDWRPRAAPLRESASSSLSPS